MWDTNGSTAGTGGTGTWNTTAGNTVWYDGSSYVSWTDNSGAVFGGTAGTVTVGANVAAGSLGVTVNTSGYTITPSGSFTVGGNVSLESGVNLNVLTAATTGNQTLAFSGTSFSGADTTAALTIQGAPTTSSAARVNLSGAVANVNVPVNITNTGAGLVGLAATASGVVLNKAVTNNSAGFAMLGATSGNTLTVNGALSGSGNWQFSAGASGGAGLITLKATSAATGNTVVNTASSGVLRFGANNVLASGALQFGNATGAPGPNGSTGAIDLAGFNQSVASLTNAGTGTVNGITNTTTTLSTLTVTGSQTTTFAGVIGIPTVSPVTGTTGNVALTLAASHSGTLSLSAANTYTGATTINGGTLKAAVASVANASGAFGLNSNVTLANTAGAKLDLNGFNTQIGSLSGGGTTGGNVTLGAGTLSVGGGTTSTTTTSYTGAISGTGGLTKVGSGTQTLNGTNSYTGVTTISAGTLLFNTPNALYNNTPASWTDTNLVVNSGGILAVTLGGTNGFTSAQVQSVSQLGTASGGLLTGSYFGIDTSNGDQTYANVIANTNAGTNNIGFVKLGANTLTLTATNTYTGGSSNGTRVVHGTLQIGDGGTVGTLGGNPVSISSGATLAFKRSDNTSNSLSISGAGGVAQNGTGILTFVNAKTYTGTTSVNAGTLKLGSSGSINGTSVISVASGATYDVTSVTGGYTLGTSTGQTLQGTGTVSGATTVASGSTIRGGSGTSVGTLTLTNGLTTSAESTIRTRITDGSTPGVTSTGSSTLGTLPNPTSNSFLNLTGGTSSINSGTLFSVDGTGTEFTLNEAYSYQIASGAGDQSGLNITDQNRFTALGFTADSFSLTGNSGGAVFLNFTPVPEPGLMLAVCGLVVGGVVAVRKLRRRTKPAEVTTAA